MRATDLQDENKYFEMVQLADWITKLQPHMVQVWLVQAWNMAYNISVKFKSPEERWLWVQRGIQLLRDDGLSYNTNQTLMYREISWIYQHKIGANLDDAHMTYKLHVAQQMQEIFPDGKAHTNELLHPPDALWRERVKKLREVYKMDPATVARVDSDYGPLDWRLPGAHAVYWAELGRMYANTNDQETLRRSIFQTMRLTCFIGGGLPASVTNVTRDNFFLRPNLDLIPRMSGVYQEMIDEEKDPGQRQSFITAHKNFVKEAIPLLYVDDQKEKAAYWFKYLKQNFTNIFNPAEANQTLDQYVLKQLAEDMGETDQYKIVGGLIGLIDSEYLCLLFGEFDKVENAHLLTEKIWQHYDNLVKEGRARLYIPPLKTLRQAALGELLNPETSRLSPFNQLQLRRALGMPDEGAVLAPTHAPIPETNYVAPPAIIK